MPVLHLKQPGFTYSACGLFTRNKERTKKFMQTGDTSYIYKSKFDKTCFQHDMAYGDFKVLARGTAADKVLRDKAFITVKDPKYDGYQRGLASMIYKFFDNKSKGSGIKNEIKENQQLANELHKLIIRKFKKRKVCSSFKDNIWGVDSADMQMVSKYDKGIRYLLCVIDIFSKYVLVELLLLIHFKIFSTIQKKLNKALVDQGSEFYNSVF